MGSGAAIFVLGPAGSGKTTFCQALLHHCDSIARPAHLFNLDPAADPSPDARPPAKDIKDLITVDEVMEEAQLGPNGALVYALEAVLLEHSKAWLEDDLEGYADEFLVIDCPGQIELYSHHDCMQRIVQLFSGHGYRPCVVYLLESHFMQDAGKFFAGVLNATAAMMQLAVPHINVISKMDLVDLGVVNGESQNGEEDDRFDEVLEESHPLHRFFFPDPRLLLERLGNSTRPRYRALNEALVQLVDEFDMVNFCPLNVRSERSLSNLLLLIDNATQYGEDIEPKEPKDEEEGRDEDRVDYDYDDDDDGGGDGGDADFDCHSLSDDDDLRKVD